MTTTRYFELRDEMRGPARWHLGMLQTSDGAEHWLRAGQLFDREDLIVPVHHPGPSMDFTMTTFGAVVVRDHLAQAILAVVGTDVQVIPVHIKGHFGYSVVHPLRVLPCLDEHLSRFKLWTVDSARPDKAGDYRDVEVFVLNGAKVSADAHIFRVKGYTILLIVSETMKQAMEAAGCHGAVFVPVELS